MVSAMSLNILLGMKNAMKHSPLTLLLVLGIVLASFTFLAPRVVSQRDKWTFLVYMGGDNSLEDEGIGDFLEMAKVGSTLDVNIVVQFDRTEGGDARYGDWTGTLRFYVDKKAQPWQNQSVEDLGELDMGNPNTLVDFFDWAVANFPADHYFLVLWDHGLSWQGVVKDATSGGDYLTFQELDIALSQIADRLGGRRVDLLGFDTCRTTLELMYQLKDYTDYFVGSEKDEDARGWAYDMFLERLVENPDSSPLQVAKSVVETYVDEYRYNSDYSVTLSVVDGKSLGNVVDSFGIFAQDLTKVLPLYGPQLREARNETERYEGGERDLYHFASNVINETRVKRLERDALDLQGEIENTVVYLEKWNNPGDKNGVSVNNAHGLCLWFPDMIPISSYYELRISADTQWDEFLQLLRDAHGVQSQLSVDGEALDEDEDGLNDTMILTLTSEVEGLLEYEAEPLSARVAGSVNVSAGEPIQLHFHPKTPGYYDFYFYLYNSSGSLENYVEYPYSESGLSIERRASMYGYVVDEEGTNLQDCQVSIVNLETGQKKETTSNKSGFAFYFIYPRWAKEGDRISITASRDDLVGGATFQMVSGEDMRVDVVLGKEVPQTLPSAGAALLVGIIVSLVLWGIAVFFLIRSTKIETIPLPVKEEEGRAGSTKCTICGADINLGVFVTRCEKCGAVYHTSCAKKVRKCPLCNEPFRF